MSHIATNWAFQQRGLKPSAKLILLALADCHNPAHGCFPSQAFLADACEINRDTVNAQLNLLEERGLIRRIRSVDPVTKRQRPTRYKLAFEDDFAAEDGGSQPANGQGKPVSEIPTRTGKAVSEKPAEPCRKIQESRVGNSDTNLVREPLREPCVGGASAAHNSTDFQAFWKAHPRPRDLEASAKLFADAVEAGEDPKRIIQAAERYAAENAGNKAMYVAYSTTWLENQRWRDYPADPMPQTVEGSDTKAAAFWASKIKSGRYVPPSAINAALADCMLRYGLVTVDQMRRAGINP